MRCGPQRTSHDGRCLLDDQPQLAVISVAALTACLLVRRVGWRSQGYESRMPSVRGLEWCQVAALIDDLDPGIGSTSSKWTHRFGRVEPVLSPHQDREWRPDTRKHMRETGGAGQHGPCSERCCCTIEG